MTSGVLKLGVAGAIVVGIVFATLSVLAMAPVNRSHVLIEDSEDVSIPADYDALLLKGDLQQGNTFVIELTVRGTIQPNYAIGTDSSIHMPAYQIELLTKEKSSDKVTVVYLLSYLDGVEKNYGFPAQATASVLRLEFPTRALLPGLHIVGVEAAVFSVESQDYVQEAPRESLQVQKAIALSINPYVILAAAAVCFAIAAILIVLMLKARIPPVRDPRAPDAQTTK
jgi:hypothetical protein